MATYRSKEYRGLLLAEKELTKILVSPETESNAKVNASKALVAIITKKREMRGATNYVRRPRVTTHEGVDA